MMVKGNEPCQTVAYPPLSIDGLDVWLYNRRSGLNLVTVGGEGSDNVCPKGTIYQDLKLGQDSVRLPESISSESDS